MPKRKSKLSAGRVRRRKEILDLRTKFPLKNNTLLDLERDELVNVITPDEIQLEYSNILELKRKSLTRKKGSKLLEPRFRKADVRKMRKKSVFKSIDIQRPHSHSNNSNQDITPIKQIKPISNGFSEITADVTVVNTGNSKKQTPNNKINKKVTSVNSRKCKAQEILHSTPQKNRRKESAISKTNANSEKTSNKESILTKRHCDRSKFLKSINTSNVFTCFSCKRLFMRKSVIIFKTKNFSPCEDLLQLFSDAEQKKEQLFICHTCSKCLKKIKFPANLILIIFHWMKFPTNLLILLQWKNV